MQLKKKLNLITENESFSKLLKRILEISQEILESEAATLFLVDHENNELVFQIVNGPESENLQGKRLEIGQGIAGKSAKNNEILLVNRPAEEGYNSKFDKNTGFNTESIIAAPLEINDEVLGVIEIINRKRGNYSEGDKEIIRRLAAQVSSELELALLSERLSRSEEFLNTIINSLPGGIIITGEEGEIRRVNKAAEDILNLKIPEGKNLKKVIPYEKLTEKILKGEIGKDFEFFIKKNETTVHLSMHLTKFSGITQSGLQKEYRIALIRDITEMVELERLKYFQELYNDFLSGIAHHLRNPLTSIVGLSNLSRKNEEIPDNIKESLDIIFRESSRMKEITDKLFDITRLNKNMGIKIDEKIELYDFFTEINKEISENKLEVSADEEGYYILGNSRWLKKILKQIIKMETQEDENSLKIILDRAGEFVNLQIAGIRGLTEKIQNLSDSSLFKFDDPLTGNSDTNYFNLPLIRLVLKHHNARISFNTDEKTLLISFPDAKSH